MEIEVEVKDGPPVTGIIRLKGYVETPQARQLRRVLEEVESRGVGRIVFEMSGVPFISSTGLSLLVSYASAKRAEWGENPVVLVGLSPAVEKTMRILGILGIFALDADIKSALGRFGLSQEAQ